MTLRLLVGSLALLVSALGAAPGARAIEFGCDGDGVQRTPVPLDYADPAAGSFDLRFRTRGGAEPSRPVVIVVPGGPGGTLIQDDPNMVSGGIPQDYAMVLTDPRGAGCNDDRRLAHDRYFSSEFLARDLLAIVGWFERQQGGRPLAYILYGQSYGTIEATIAAVLAAREGLTTPRLMVLEGTLGHSFSSYEEHFANLQAEWRSVRERLPRAWRAVFRDNRFDPNLNPFPSVWADMVDNDLSQGYLSNGDHVLEWRLTEGNYTLPHMLGMFETQPRGDSNGKGSRVLRVIACTELYGGLYVRRTFKDGELVLEGDNLCQAPGGPGGGITRRFDAAQWPLTMPLVYFQGQHDPATPIEQARYHFDHETAAPRYFVSIDLAGHAALTVTLNVGECPAGLWGAISGDMALFPAAVKKCDSLERMAHVRLDYQPGQAVLASPAVPGPSPPSVDGVP